MPGQEGERKQPGEKGKRARVAAQFPRFEEASYTRANYAAGTRRIFIEFRRKKDRLKRPRCAAGFDRTRLNVF